MDTMRASLAGGQRAVGKVAKGAKFHQPSLPQCTMMEWIWLVIVEAYVWFCADCPCVNYVHMLQPSLIRTMVVVVREVLQFLHSRPHEAAKMGKTAGRGLMRMASKLTVTL
eukprot:5199219-Amphidinium_carterae.1